MKFSALDGPEPVVDIWSRSSAAPPCTVLTVNSITGLLPTIAALSIVATRPPICSICSAVNVEPVPMITGPPASMGTSTGPVGPVGPVGPGPPDGPSGPDLPSSPSQPARPIVAASASIAIKGTRDRVMPRAPAIFMDDSLIRSKLHHSKSVRIVGFGPVLFV
jgi:hypothetical protein